MPAFAERRAHLRLVDNTRPAPRKFLVRLSVSDVSPVGRTRAFRLTRDDIAIAIEALERLERAS